MKTGTVIHGTLPEDLIPAFAAELAVRDDGTYKGLVAAARAWDPADPDGIGTDLCLELEDALDELAPPGISFGAHPRDGSNFGFWPLSYWEEGRS